MTLKEGSVLGGFEIRSQLGAGGMGEVFLARDTSLDRLVAIKVLPQSMTSDSVRVTRFEREAKLLAVLNHPNIAAVYGFDRCDDTRFLVMEYVEGVTLAERLATGPLTTREALEAARQMAQALEAAHEKGVVHRDLKPANVMLRKDESVKVLDFGLAKAMSEVDSLSPAVSTTLTAQDTKPGMILGTAAYMSPEQAQGKELDTRTDVWSFGVILFESLTGKTLFHGDTVSDSIGAILHKDPDWALLPDSTPSAIRLLLRRCLTRDRRNRLQAIGDARVELEELDTTQEWMDRQHATAPVRSSASVVMVGLLCAFLGVVVTIWATGRDRTQVDPGTAGKQSKSTITLEDGAALNWQGSQDTWGKIGFSRLVAVSDDAKRIVFTVQEGKFTNLYLKDQDHFEPIRIDGAKGARGAFLSPDGNWVGYLAEKMMHKVRLPGGASQSICEVTSAAFDATWLEDGTIVYSTDLGLWQVHEDGGVATQLTSIDFDAGIRGHRFPQKIPGHPYFLFTVAHETAHDTALFSLETGDWQTLKRQASDARLIADKYLLFARDGELLASSYDPADPMRVGTEETVVRNVQTIPGQGGTIVHLFGTSLDGLLTYAPQTEAKEDDALVWVDHQGNEELIVKDSGYWMHQRLSPDGTRILYNRLTSDGMIDLYIHDVVRGQTSRLTRRGFAYDAEWSPDGKLVGFAALDTAGRSIFIIPADFSGPASKIMPGSNARPHFSQWTEDGSTLVFFDRSSQGGIWTARPEEGAKLVELINTELGEAWARISPDRSLIAYVGWESGQRHVYVQAYPSAGPRVRVSNKGGGEPRWVDDSRTLYFREDQKLYRAVVETEPNLNVRSVETLLFEDTYECAASGHQHYDLTPDGSKLLMIRHGKRTDPNKLHVISNWMATLDAGK